MVRQDGGERRLRDRAAALGHLDAVEHVRLVGVLLDSAAAAGSHANGVLQPADPGVVEQRRRRQILQFRFRKTEALAGEEAQRHHLQRVEAQRHFALPAGKQMQRCVVGHHGADGTADKGLRPCRYLGPARHQVLHHELRFLQRRRMSLFRLFLTAAHLAAAAQGFLHGCCRVACRAFHRGPGGPGGLLASRQGFGRRPAHDVEVGGGREWDGALVGMHQHRRDAGGTQFIEHARRFDQEFRADEIVAPPAALQFDEVPRAQLIHACLDRCIAASQTEHSCRCLPVRNFVGLAPSGRQPAEKQQV